MRGRPPRLEPRRDFRRARGQLHRVSATVLQPLKAYHREEYRLAPFTVLVDPGRPPCYLARNQIAEADLVVATKADLYPDAALAADYRVSSQTGDGVEPWLDDVLSGRRVAGSRLLDGVDYDVYAKAEAALGWVNLHADLHLRVAASPASVVGPLLDDLDESLAEITHLKVFDRAAGGYVKAAICGKGQEPAVARRSARGLLLRARTRHQPARGGRSGGAAPGNPARAGTHRRPRGVSLFEGVSPRLSAPGAPLHERGAVARVISTSTRRASSVLLTSRGNAMRLPWTRSPVFSRT